MQMINISSTCTFKSQLCCLVLDQLSFSQVPLCGTNVDPNQINNNRSCTTHTPYNGYFVSSICVLDCVVVKALHGALADCSYNVTQKTSQSLEVSMMK